MKRYARNYLIGLVSYAVLAETCVYGSIHEWSVDPFLMGNAILLLAVGGVMLFVFGLYGLVEGFWG